MIECVTHHVEETRALGHALAATLAPGIVVELTGGLGVGKTALTQGIGAGLGVTSRITSPTFTMVATHETDGTRGIEMLLHADLYRVSSAVEADDLAIGEQVEEAAVAVVEWSDVAPDVLGPRRMVLALRLGDDDEDRVITVDLMTSGIDEALVSHALTPWRTR
jgi:tRNA threonylcarbamoyladenosine biosynthesis protein TsaE